MDNATQNDSLEKYDIFLDKLATIVFEIILSEELKAGEQQNKVA